MSRVSSLAPFTLVALGCLVAQGHAQTDDAQPIDANSRVKRCLNNLMQAQNYAFRSSTKSSANAAGPFGAIRVAGQNAKPAADVTEGVRVGPTVIWTRDDGETVLANRGRTWLTKDRDGNWIPGRRPLGNWKNRYLPDPEFLASSLVQLMKRTKWELAGTDELDEKPVRVYKLKLEGDDAKYLMRTQTLPQSSAAALGGAVAQFVVIAGAGGRAPKVQEPDTKIEIRIYEDPAKRMPLEITADLWIEGGGGIGGVFVAAGGGGVQLGRQQKNDDEDDEKKEKKPTLTVNFDINKVGSATTDVLDDDAKAVLGK